MSSFLRTAWIVVLTSACLMGCDQFHANNLSSQTGGGSSENANGNNASGATKVVSVAVGVGGRILAGSEGFANILVDREVFSPELQAQIVYDSAGAAISCPQGLSVMNAYGGKLCCYKPGECIGGGFHSDFLFRGIAFGNGRFVAVGGFVSGFSYVSTDGVHWSERNPINAAAGTLTGRTATNWIGGVAFGNGVFVGVGADKLPLVSTDGLHWSVTATTPAPGNLREIFFLGDHFFASGDNGTWAITKDGSTWTSSGTSPFTITSVVRQGDWMYGVVSNGSMYKASATDGGANWIALSVAGPFRLLVLSPLGDLFRAFSANYAFSTASPDGTWVRENSLGVGRSVKHTGQYFVTANLDAARSVDGKTWTPYPSGTGFTQPLLAIANGAVRVP